MSIPYNIFDRELAQQEAQAAKKLKNIYHKGQEKSWDGRTLLSELVKKHGQTEISPEKQEAIHNIFSMILWGEYAAWKVSAELATMIEPMEPKMAATSQAHDEARHFYVMYDYLSLLGHEPGKLTSGTTRVLESVASTKNLGKKLLGMQLMVEPVALTIFRLVRESQVEPVLCELLEYYERDEARHVALGVKYLPSVIRQMQYHEIFGLFIWQFRILLAELDGLKDLEKDFEVLGFGPEQVFEFAEKKQLACLNDLGNELGINSTVWDPLRRLVAIKKEIYFSKEPAFLETGIIPVDKIFSYGQRVATAIYKSVKI